VHQEAQKIRTHEWVASHGMHVLGSELGDRTLGRLVKPGQFLVAEGLVFVDTRRSARHSRHKVTQQHEQLVHLHGQPWEFHRSHADHASLVRDALDAPPLHNRRVQQLVHDALERMQICRVQLSEPPLAPRRLGRHRRL
jgi:hypothetical protein